MTPIVTTAEAKTHLRVYHDEENAQIDALVQAAQEWIQQTTGLEFVSTSRTLYLDRFPGGNEMFDGWEWQPVRIHADLSGRVMLPYSPVSTVASVKYYDADNSLQTLAGSNYQANTAARPARISLSSTGTWPVTYSKENAVEIAYTAGYGATAASVPYALKQACLLLVGEWYAFRENALMPLGNWPKEIPDGVTRLLSAFTVRAAL